MNDHDKITTLTTTNEIPRVSSLKMTSERRHISTLQILVKTVIASIGFFFFGYQQGILNLSLKTLNVIFDIQKDD